MTWADFVDGLAFAAFFGGCLLALVASIGALRFPDLLSRMHAGTKPQTLGLLLILTGIALRLQSWPAVWTFVLIALCQMLTAPVAAHMVGRAGFRTGKVRRDLLVVDELSDDISAGWAKGESNDEQPGDAGRGAPAPGHSGD